MDTNGDYVNKGFESNETKQDLESQNQKNPIQTAENTTERPKWDNQLEFLMSCIATSVGLGNVWRFPFVAYQNGGGAFLIPYIIVLLIIGKSMYYLETVLGQFSNSNCVKIWALSPAMKGTGYTQALGATSFPGLFATLLGKNYAQCVESGSLNEGIKNPISSAQLYFTETVLKQSDGIHDGIGAPLWDLTLCLLASWVIIFVIVARGVKSSGKASYFLALFPYVIMFILLIRAVTLPGAKDGILFFLTPDWNKILEVKVWYAAVTQCFFSLSVCSGALIMFSSYNSFSQNVYRDSMIVTTLDTLTSLLSGITIFGIIGNLAYQLNYTDISQVVGSGGASLAFVSYPDAIAKSPFLPQLFAVMFFVMMAVLGVGSGVALLSTVNTILLDAFPRVPTIYMSAMTCTAGFLVGLVYVTPGGQYILELVDYYGGTFMRLFAAIAETIGVFWIYGLENICLDIEYMLGIKTSFYWRICWAILTPFIMVSVFIYALANTKDLVYGGDGADGGYIYPDSAYFAGKGLQYIGMALIPLFIIIALWKYRTGNFILTVKSAFRKEDTRNS
ncbi:hypothetical protein ACJJTC_004056 [Scirpophaga incertulas]